MDDFRLKWINATRNHNRGIGGCLVGVKKSVVKKFNARLTKFNNIITIYIKINGRVIIFIPIYLNCNNWMLDFNGLGEILEQLKEANAELCLMGDLNARTGTLQNLDRHIVDSGFVSKTRKSKDTIVNYQGRQLLQLLKDHRLIIVNGRCNGNSLGEITFRK